MILLRRMNKWLLITSLLIITSIAYAGELPRYPSPGCPNPIFPRDQGRHIEGMPKIWGPTVQGVRCAIQTLIQADKIRAKERGKITSFKRFLEKEKMGFKPGEDITIRLVIQIFGDPCLPLFYLTDIISIAASER